MLPEQLKAMFPHASAAFLAKNAGISAPVPRQMRAAVVKTPETKRIRQHQGDGLNGWERTYWQTELDGKWTYIYREVALPLANGLKYKLDWLVVRKADGTLTIEGHEVKGRALAAGIAKVKMAARLYPWITFRLVTKRRKKQGGGWAIEEVLP